MAEKWLGLLGWRQPALHQRDLNVNGSVKMPLALKGKYPYVQYELKWQYVFPATTHYFDPDEKVERRHHLHESVLHESLDYLLVFW